MCGMKLTCDSDSRIWSGQMESVRKDIECCYGILKVRFKILAYPIQFHSRKGKLVRLAPSPIAHRPWLITHRPSPIAIHLSPIAHCSYTFDFYSSYVIRELQDYVRKINNTVWSCCILHNLLLSYDGNLCFHSRCHAHVVTLTLSRSHCHAHTVTLTLSRLRCL